MTIYILNFLSILLYWLIYKAVENKKGSSKILLNFFMCLITVQLILLVGLRGSHIGKDTLPYIRRFNVYRNYTLSEIFKDDLQEIGYSLLIKAVGLFTDNFQWFAIAAAALSIIPIMIVIRKCSTKPFLSVLLLIALGYYTPMFCIMRQVIAYAFCMYSYLYIKDRKFTKFLIAVLLATQFHSSAYLFLPAYFLTKIKLNNITVVCTFAVSIIVWVFSDEILIFITRYVYSNHIVSDTGAGTWMMMCSVIVIIGLMLHSRVKERVGSSCDEIYMILFAGLVLMIFAGIAGNAMRAANYYYMFVILFIPGILDALEDKKLASLCMYGVLAASIVLYVWFLVQDDYNVVPYQFFWQRW